MQSYGVLSRILIGVAVVGALTGCTTQRQIMNTPDVTFLTGDGCPNSTKMRQSLDAALSAVGWPTTYAVIDVDTLPRTDARAGYGTPTVLIRNRDLFGMPEPQIPIATDAPT